MYNGIVKIQSLLVTTRSKSNPKFLYLAPHDKEYSQTIFKTNYIFTMVKCVNMETYKARMACLDEREKKVIISVLENKLIDKVWSDIV